MKTIYVLDGHDGAGKTIIAKMVAEVLNLEYVKPFNNDLGDLIAWAYKKKMYEDANRISYLAIKKSIIDTDKDGYIFDRHWLSMFTVLPQEYHSSWFPLPKTILLWANLDKTISRLNERGEDIDNLADHKYYINKYLEIARFYNVSYIDTSYSTVDNTVMKVVSMLKNE